MGVGKQHNAHINLIGLRLTSQSDSSLSAEHYRALKLGRLTETDAIRMILIRTNDFLPHMPDRVLDAAARRLRGGRKSSDADHVEFGYFVPISRAYVSDLRGP
jgi:hypothetical protein